MTPAAARIRDIWRDPPRGGWTRRTFLQTLTAARTLPLATSSSAFAQARTAAGRIRSSRSSFSGSVLRKTWGTYEDYMGGRRGGRTGGGAIVEIHTDQGLVGIGPHGVAARVASRRSRRIYVGRDPFDVNRHTAFLYGGGREGGLGGGQRPTGVPRSHCGYLIGKAANQPLYKLWGGTVGSHRPVYEHVSSRPGARARRRPRSR